MKRMKKAFALMLAMVMTLSMATVAFAANVASGEDATKTTASYVEDGVEKTKVYRDDGSITIQNTHNDTVYSLYKMLHLESYSEKNGTEAFSYVIMEGWEDFFLNDGPGAEYININAQGYVEWAKTRDDATLNQFAYLALQYAKTQVPDPMDSSKTIDQVNPVKTHTGGGTIEDLTLGYYLIDSDVGVLCGLTTTSPKATIQPKNGAPSLVKKVLEDSITVGAKYSDTNDADIGQMVEFDITITVHKGAQNYTLHDQLADGFKFDTNTWGLEVSYTPNGASTGTLLKPHEVGETEEQKNQADYTVKTAQHTCTFEIEFDQDFCSRAATGDMIVVSYKALLDSDAVIKGEGNVNKAWVTYGDLNTEGTYGKHETMPSETKTFTYRFDLVKTDAASTPSLLSGAQFKLYDTLDAKNAATENNDTAIRFVKSTEKLGTNPDAKTIDVYRRATATDANTTTEIVVTDGYVRFTGLDASTYYLVETVAPAGYNKLAAHREISIMSDDPSEFLATFNATTGEYEGVGNAVHVQNSTGVALPSTGGMGTVMFITCGSIVVMAAGVLLVTKKRMSMIQD